MPEILKNISQVKLRMRRGAVVFGEVVYDPGGVCGPRTQHDYQLVILHRGEVELSLDERRINVPARHGILLCPGHREKFVFSRDRETHHTWCSVDAGAIPAVLRRRLRQCAAVSVPVDLRTEALMTLGREAFLTGESDQFLENSFHLSLGLALIAGFARGVQARPAGLRPADQSVRRADQFIQNEFSRRLSLADIATAAGVSRQHLLKLFRLRRGKSPMQCLYERRLAAAAGHLVHTGLAVKQIAERCGFANEFHFSRKFKEAYGRSPRGLRLEHWERPNLFRPGAQSPCP